MDNSSDFRKLEKIQNLKKDNNTLTEERIELYPPSNHELLNKTDNIDKKFT